jgi:hypothetical protein
MVSDRALEPTEGLTSDFETPGRAGDIVGRPFHSSALVLNRHHHSVLLGFANTSKLNRTQLWDA